MKTEKVEEIIGEIDERYINEAVLMEKPRRSFSWALAAVILVLIMTGSITWGAFSAEAKEYEKAEAFFEENGLSSEGLTRAELKAVYKDISLRHFSNEKTAEVIRKSVPGYEIDQEEPSPEELAAVWDWSVWKKTVSKRGYAYDVEYVEEEPVGEDSIPNEKAVLRCYKDGKLLWTAEFLNQSIYKHFRTEGGTVVWGLWWSRSKYGATGHSWVAILDDEGKQVWRNTLGHDCLNEQIGGVINHGDGTFTVVSSGVREQKTTEKLIYLSRFDAQGREISCHKIEGMESMVTSAVQSGEAYLLQMSGYGMKEVNLFLRVDPEGYILDRFSVEADDCDYFFTDMTEFHGQIYFSGYTVPKQPIKDVRSNREEVYTLLECLWNRYYTQGNPNGISSEELTQLLREHYTAVLLLYDPEAGTPETFYSVKGSLGSGLTVEDGYLEWNVESIVQSVYSPATSSFTIGGSCEVFMYTFDSSGHLVHQEDTQETVPYRR